MSKLRTNLLLMYLSQALSLVAVFLCTWMVIRRFGEASFGEYSLFRRGVSFATTLSSVGLLVAAPRLLIDRAMQASNGAVHVSRSLVIEFGGALGILAAAFGALALIVGADRIAELVLGQPTQPLMGWVIVGAVLGFLLYIFVFELLRLLQRFRAIFVLQMGYFFALPIVALLLLTDLRRALTLTVGASLVWTMSFVPIVLRQTAPDGAPARLQEVWTMLRNAVTYAPIPYLTLALFSIPAFATLHLVGAVDAGYMAFSAALVSAAGQTMTPVMVVLRGQLRVKFLSGDGATVRRWWRYLLFMVVLATAVMSIIIVSAGSYLIGLYFSPVVVAPPYQMLVFVVFASSFGYLLHTAAFSFLEAIAPSHRGIQINTAVAFTVLVAGMSLGYLFAGGSLAIAASQALAFSILGVLSVLRMEGLARRQNESNRPINGMIAVKNNMHAADAPSSTASGACRACGLEQLASYGEKDGFAAVKCRSCGHVSTVDMPTADALTTFYVTQYFRAYAGGVGYERAAADGVRGFNRKIAMIKKLVPLDSRILEVGSASGVFLGQLKAAGFSRVRGCDISSDAVTSGRSGELDLRATDIHDSANDDWLGSFDLVLSWATIEHVVDPVQFVARCASFVAPGGYMLIDTGVVDTPRERLAGTMSSWYYPPEHLHVFSEQSLRALFERFFDVECYVNFERSRAWKILAAVDSRVRHLAGRPRVAVWDKALVVGRKRHAP